MKNLVSILMTLFLILAISTPTFAEKKSEVPTNKIDTSDWVTYKIKELGMSIKLPPDMKVYTRESIKLGNVNEDENFNNIRNDFENAPLHLKAKNEHLNFIVTISKFSDFSSFLFPNLFYSKDTVLEKYIKISNKYGSAKHTEKFVSPHGNFTSSTELDTHENISRVFSYYVTFANYQQLVITFNTKQNEIPNYTQDTYNEVINSIKISNYRFNFIFLFMILAFTFLFFVIFYAIHKLIIKLRH